MMVQDVLKCKTCFAELDPSSAVNGTVKCPYCNNVWTVARKESKPEALEFLRIGEHELDTGRFNEAYEAYRKCAELEDEEPEAYFGMALSEFRVQYIKDEVNNRLQPICHVPTDKKFAGNKNYRLAIGYATDEQQVEYKRRAEEIEYINRKFYEWQQAGVDYDCFLCVKVTGENGEKTQDAKDADYIWQLLTDKGYTPFYSERNIRGQTGADYEAMILHALFTSETMIVICRDADYLHTPWVKNEYTRFLHMMRDGDKETDAVTVAYGGAVIEQLPGKRGKIQGIDLDKRGSDDLLLQFVDTHTPQHKQKKEAERQAKLEAEERRRKEQEEIKRQLEELRSSQLRGSAVQHDSGTLERFIARYAATDSIIQKVRLIREYEIPTEKESILQYAAWIQNNFKPSVYLSSPAKAQADIALADILLERYDVLCRNGQALYVNDPDMEKLAVDYQSKKKEAEQAKAQRKEIDKKEKRTRLFVSLGVIFAVVIAIIILSLRVWERLKGETGWTELGMIWYVIVMIFLSGIVWFKLVKPHLLREKYAKITFNVTAELLQGNAEAAIVQADAALKSDWCSEINKIKLRDLLKNNVDAALHEKIASNTKTADNSESSPPKASASSQPKPMPPPQSVPAVSAQPQPTTPPQQIPVAPVPPMSPIVIEKSVYLIQVPSFQANSNYQTVVKKFKKAGFTKVTSYNMKDMVFGVFHNEGELLDVYINSERVSSGQGVYPQDAPVVIRYHGSKIKF